MGAIPMTLKYKFDMRLIIAIIAMILVVSGCRINGQRLRGNTTLGVRFPIYTTQQEIIQLSSDRIASRSFLPATARTDINSMIVPEPLWKDLEQLRLSWCQQPAKFVSVTPNDADYRIILKCEQSDEDPSYFVHPSDLPMPLQKLIDLVPSTSERLLPQ
jgi:hypothetical protein